MNEIRVACYVSGRGDIGGAERRLMRIFDALGDDIDVFFVARSFEGEAAPEETYRSFSSNGKVTFMTVKNSDIELFRFVYGQKFDVVFFIGPYKEMLPFLLAGKLSGSKCIWLLVNTFYAARVFENGIQKVMFATTSLLSDRVDLLFPAEYEALKKYYRSKPLSITPCPFTDLVTFRPAAKSKTMVFLSRLVKGKNADLLIRAMTLIEDDLKEAHYKVIVAGDGPEFEVIERLVKDCGLEETVQLPGYVDPSAFLPTAEVFFSLQDLNNYPSQSLLEAIACGCYVVATDVGDTQRLVSPEFGQLCKSDAHSIAQAVRSYIFLDEESKKVASQKARTFAEATFDISRSVNHYEDMIRESVC